VHSAPWPITYRLAGANPPLAKEFSTLLTGCGFVQTSENDARLTIKFVHSDELAVGDYSSEAVVDWRDLKISKHETRILFRYRSWNLDLDVGTATIRCSGPEPTPVDRVMFREFFLISPILWMLHRSGHFELHAAAGVHEDFGYLLLGPSGSGKTTTILSLIASGWNYLSDDATVVSADQEGGIWAHPLRRSFSLKPDHLTRHPELAEHATELVPATNKRRLDPRKVWPEQYTDVAKPRFIISCKVTDEETTRIIPMSRAESLARLVASTPWLMLDRLMAPAHLEIFRSLAATCCGFELRAGREMFRAGSNIASLIAPEVLSKEEAWA
jgi:hypothetical protein